MLMSELPKLTDARVSQCVNAKLPILVTVLGIVISSRAEQRAKADLAIAVTESPNPMVFNEEQPIKAASPMEQAALAMVAVANLPHS